MKIANSVFLVTGGASGLGAATARMVVGGGGQVVIADLNEEAGKALAAELGAAACFVRTDVTDEVSTQAAVDAAVKGFGGLHGLVCCAGVAPGEKVVGKEGPHRLDSFMRGVTINLVGTFNPIRLAADAMSKAAPNEEGERGVIVTTASVAAFDGQIGQAAYSASKAGVVGMTLPMARDLAQHGIRVCTIAPGLFATPLLKELPEPVQESLAKSIPFPQRLGKPEEFAQLAAHIVSNGHLNGEVIRLDGALRMAPR